MATVQFTRSEVEQIDMPFVCMLCGEQTAEFQHKSFTCISWSWGNLAGILCGVLAGAFACAAWFQFVEWPWSLFGFLALPLGIILAVLVVGDSPKPRRISVPIRLCETHMKQSRYEHLIAGAIFVLVFFGVPLTIETLEHQAPNVLPAWAPGLGRSWFILIWYFMLALIPILLPLLDPKWIIRATEITATSVTLTGASPEFAEAVLAYRESGKDEPE